MKIIILLYTSFKNICKYCKYYCSRRKYMKNKNETDERGICLNPDIEENVVDCAKDNCRHFKINENDK